jgi:hypothetical protein
LSALPLGFSLNCASLKPPVVALEAKPQDAGARREVLPTPTTLSPQNFVYVAAARYLDDSQWQPPTAQPTRKEVKSLPFMSAHRRTLDEHNGGAVYITTYGGGVWSDVPPTITSLRPSPRSTTKDRTLTSATAARETLTDLTCDRPRQE